MFAKITFNTKPLDMSDRTRITSKGFNCGEQEDAILPLQRERLTSFGENGTFALQNQLTLNLTHVDTQTEQNG